MKLRHRIMSLVIRHKQTEPPQEMPLGSVGLRIRFHECNDKRRSGSGLGWGLHSH